MLVDLEIVLLAPEGMSAKPHEKSPSNSAATFGHTKVVGRLVVSGSAVLPDVIISEGV